MENFDVYSDVANRTGGDIFVGVVGPVRTGKSTFIRKFMDVLVLPNIIGKNKKQIAVDELPQSGEGKTITTTEPKFVPSEAVKISINGKVQARVRLIDSVGFMIDGAIGDSEDGKPRLVKTPWSEELIPFEQAATTGTEKVIKDHATVVVLITSDGSIVDLPRNAYLQAEDKTIEALRLTGKPFTIVVNSKTPDGKEAQAVVKELSAKYGVNARAVNVQEMDEKAISSIIEDVLMEFPMQTFDVRLPKWMQVLNAENPIISSLLQATKNFAPAVEKMKHYKYMEDAFGGIDGISGEVKTKIDLSEGRVEYSLSADSDLFFKTLSEVAGEDITEEYNLMSYVKKLNVAKNSYEKLKSALGEVDDDGYGVVVPVGREMSLGEPKVVKQGGRYGVKLKANTSCMHLIKVDVDAEVSPVYGTEKQCKDFADYIKEEYDNNPEAVWNTSFFGKPLYKLVEDEITSKVTCMKQDTKNKMRRTVTRIVNEGRGGVICILL